MRFRHVPVTLLMAVAALAPATPPSAAAVDSPAEAATPPPLVISAVTATGYRARVPIGDAVVRRGDASGVVLDEISIPGGIDASAPGAPQLPARVVMLRVPWGVEPRVRATPGAARQLGSLRPVPFARLVTEEAARARRGQAEVREALASTRYASSMPGDVIRATALMAAGTSRVLAVTLAPVLWDARGGAAWQFEEITLDVSWDRPVEAVAESAPRAREAAVGALDAGADRGGIAGPHYAPRPRTPPPSKGYRPKSSAAAPAAASLRLDPTRPWVRLGTTRLGLYRVTPADLAAAGVAVASIDPATFRLFHTTPGDLPESVDVDLGPDSLRECGIVVAGEGDGSFDTGDALYFYGTGAFGFRADLTRGGSEEYVEAQRTFQASYWLTWGAGTVPGSPLRMGTRDAAPASTGAPLVTSTTHRIHFEQNRLGDFNLAAPGVRWERWFERFVVQGGRVAYPLALPNPVVGGAGSAHFRVWGKQGSIGYLIPDHVARLSWDRAVVDTAGWDFTLPQDLSGSGFAVGLRDTLEIAVPLLTDASDPNRSDTQYAAWFEVAYPRRLQASFDTLFFAAPDSLPGERVQYAVGGAGDTLAAWCLDRTDPDRPVRLVGGSWTGAAAPFTLTFEDSVGGGYRPRYALLSTSRATTPATIALYAPLAGPHVVSDLLDPANDADYIVVAPPVFLAAAESLAAERSTSLSGVASPRAVVVTTDRIFAQFGGGTPDPTAIRNFLAYAFRHWARPPIYLCLLGDASGDPLDYSGLNAVDYVPTYSNGYDGFLGEQYILDDWLVRLDGPSDQLLDMAAGRLPARSPQEALEMVRGKRRVYENSTAFDLARNRVLLSADDSWKHDLPLQQDLVGLDHTRQMERKDRFHIPFPATRAKVYLNDYAFADSGKTSKPGAREAFIGAVNLGNWLVDYVGHGSGTLIADEQLFRSLDVSRLTNTANPSLWAFMSCTVGRFDDYRSDGMAEILLRLPSGGASVALAASQEVFGGESTVLNDAFIDELFPLTARVDSLRTAGLAWARAKNHSASTTFRKYNFLGEPGLRLPLPRGRGVWEKAPLDSALRGEVVTFSGHAIQDDGTPDTTASGTAKLRVLGPPSRRLLQGWQGGNPGTAPYDLPGPVLYQGDVALVRGSFAITMTIPVDGRVSGGGGRLEALLEEAGGHGMGLAADSIIIGAGLAPRVDVTPPTIALLAPPDTIFAAGDRLTFAIQDSSGLDLTHFDNAHGIFVLFDDAGLPIDLTSAFAYDRGSATQGTVVLTLPALAEGAHRLEIHASDTYRNVGVATFVIEVSAKASAGQGLDVSQVFNYPNPFDKETFLHVKLNQAARLKITILTVAGRRVRSWTADGKAGENYLPWDGSDSQGEKVAIGVYLFHVTAEAPGSSRVEAVGRALKTR